MSGECKGALPPTPAATPGYTKGLLGYGECHLALSLVTMHTIKICACCDLLLALIDIPLYQHFGCVVTLALAKSIHVPLTLRLTFTTTCIREMVTAHLDLVLLKICTILTEMWTGIAASIDVLQTVNVWRMAMVFSYIYRMSGGGSCSQNGLHKRLLMHVCNN